jgi:hypothetical protein
MSTLQIGNNVTISGSGAGPGGNKTYGTIAGIYRAEGIIPTGSIIYTATIAANSTTGRIPDGYLACDGSLVSQSDYRELYEALGSPSTTSTLWNRGVIGGFPGVSLNDITSNWNPSIYFRVPYLKGVFIRCWDGPGGYALDLYNPQPRPFGSFTADVDTSADRNTDGSVALMAIIKY